MTEGVRPMRQHNRASPSPNVKMMTSESYHLVHLHNSVTGNTEGVRPIGADDNTTRELSPGVFTGLSMLTMLKELDL